MTFPVELTHPKAGKIRNVEGKFVEKILHARNQEELDGLLKLGWQVKS